MINQKSQILILWFFFWDLILTAFAWVAAYFLRFHSGWFSVQGPTLDLRLCLHNLPLLLLISAVAYRITGQYEIDRFRRLREELVSVCKGTLFMGLLVIATTFGLHDPYESRGTLLIFFGLTVVLDPGSSALHLGGRPLAAQPRLQPDAGHHRRHRPGGAQDRPRRCAHASWMGIKNVGFVEDQPTRWTQRPGHPGHHRRPARLDRASTRSRTSSSPCR